MKRILTTTAEPEINVKNEVACVYFDQFGNEYIVEYKVKNLDAETFEDVADWDDFSIYEGGYFGKDVTDKFVEEILNCNQVFVSKDELTEEEIEDEVFEEKTLTFTEESKEGDIFQKLQATGYFEDSAKSVALNELKYSCCSDFTTPKSCKKGCVITYFKACGIPFYDIADYDENEIAEICGWEQALIFEFRKEKFAVPADFDEYKTGGEIKSDDAREFDTWDEVIKNL